MEAILLRRSPKSRAAIRTSEDVVVSRVGRDLYEKMFRGYTRKQWGLDPSELDASVTARIPVRTQSRRSIFHGHLPGDAAARFHPHVRKHAGPSEHNASSQIRTIAMLLKIRPLSGTGLTGPVDEFFDYRFGKLPYRSHAFPA